MSSLIVLHGVNTIHDSQGHCVLIDIEDWSEVSQYRWTFNRNSTGQIYICTGSPAIKIAPARSISLHRLLIKATPGTQVDHRNGDTLDNRRDNLRICTVMENGRNKRKGWGRSKYKGVCWCKQKSRWKASVQTATVRIQRYHVDEKDAARAYDRIALEHFGEFACTNAEIYGDL